MSRAARLATAIATAIATADYKTLNLLKHDARTKGGRAPKGLRVSDRNPGLHEQIQARHNSNPSKLTLKREGLAVKRDKARKAKRDLARAKRDAEWLAKAEVLP